RQASVRAPRRPPPPKPRGHSGLSNGLAALWRAAWPHWPWALAVLLVGSGGVLGLALVAREGSIAQRLYAWQLTWLGWTAALLPLWLTALGGAVLMRHLRPDAALPWRRGIGAALASAAFVGLAALAASGRPDAAGGGRVGLALTAALAEAFGLLGAGVLLALAAVGGLLLAFRVPPARLARLAARAVVLLCVAARAIGRRFQALRARLAARPALLPLDDEARPGLRQRLVARVRRRRAAPDDEPAAGEEAEATTDDPAPARASRPSRKAPAAVPAPPPPARGAWQLPPLKLLALPSSPSIAPVDLRQRARIIEETLESFNIGARVVEINEGPTVTQFGIEPAMGVTVARITARTNDLALRLGATTLRVEAPVPGKRVVGIEVPNSASAVVSLREILAAPEFEKLKSRLGLALGRDVAGRAVAGDLARMPHLLIAG